MRRCKFNNRKYFDKDIQFTLKNKYFRFGMLFDVRMIRRRVVVGRGTQHNIITRCLLLLQGVSILNKFKWNLRKIFLFSCYFKWTFKKKNKLISRRQHITNKTKMILKYIFATEYHCAFVHRAFLPLYITSVKMLIQKYGEHLWSSCGTAFIYAFFFL